MNFAVVLAMLSLFLFVELSEVSCFSGNIGGKKRNEGHVTSDGFLFGKKRGTITRAERLEGKNGVSIWIPDHIVYANLCLHFLRH